LLLATLLGLLSLAGYQAREMGLLRPQHGESVGIKHLAAWLATGLLFYGVGFNLLFGPGGFVGWSGQLILPDPLALRAAFDAGLAALPDGWPAPDYPGPAFLLLHFTLAATVLSILSGALAERTHFFAFLLIGALSLLLIYPVFGHWVWGQEFLPRNSAWLGQLGFYDLAGSTVVHSVAGWIALAGIIQVGPRTGRFTAEAPTSFAPAALSYSVLGVILVWLGTLFINVAAWGRADTELAMLPVNISLAAIAAGSAAFAHAYWRSRPKTYLYCLGGTLAGVVAASGGAQLYTPGSILLLGLVAGLLHNLAADGLLRRQWDDPIGAIPVHLCGGIWGTVGLALLGRVERFPRNVDLLAFSAGDTDPGIAAETTDLIVNRLQQLLAQGFGVLVAGIWSFGIAWLLLRFLRSRGALRLSEAEEGAGA
jgi:Amt family ammonium transporter